MKEVYEFIKKCNTYYLATVENDQARVRPFGTINLFEDKLYIQTGKSKKVSKEIQNNAKVELCCFDGSSWCRLSGLLVRDDRLEAKKDMLDHYPSLRSMYNEHDDNTEVLYFKDAIAIISSFGKEDKIIRF